MDESESVEANAVEGLLRLSEESRQLYTNSPSVRSSDSTIMMEGAMDIDDPDGGSPGNITHQSNSPENVAAPSHTEQPTRSSATQTDNKPVEQTPEESGNLQAYLIHQQLLAGIRPENIIPMRGRVNEHPSENTTRQPTLLQIGHDGISVPNVPPARFTGAIHTQPLNTDWYNQPAASTIPVKSPQNNSARSHSRPARKSNRRLPRVPHDSPFEARHTLKSVAYSRPSWIDAIPRIAEFAHASLNKINLAFAQQNTHPLLPGVNDLLRGVPAPSVTIPHSTTPVSESHKSEDASAARTAEAEAASVLASHISDTESMSSTLTPAATPLALREESDAVADSLAPTFNLLKALFTYGDIGLVIADHLSLTDVINLMTISKPFNHIIKSHESATALQKARQEAPEAAHAYPPVCYPRLCLRKTNANGTVSFTTDPSLRWASMAIYRDKASHEILDEMNEQGYGLPPGCAGMLKKLWFLFDIPNNKRREWTAKNKNIWTDMDVFYCTFFLVNVDAYVRTKFDNRSGGLRRLSMAQPSLTFFLDVLKGKRFHTLIDMLRTFVQWQYKPEPYEVGGPVFAVPAEQVGILQYENYGRGGERTVKFIRPDVCVLKEVKRRGLDMEQMYITLAMMGESACDDTEQPSWDEEVRRCSELRDSPEWVKEVHLSLQDWMED